MRYLNTTAPLITALLLLVSGAAHGQGLQGSGSPYSAYGFGNLVGSAQVTQALMGGAGVAVFDPFGAMPINPASYASLSRPVFEIGMALRGQEFITGKERQVGQRSDMLGFSLAGSFGQGRWGFAMGLNPVSKVGYRVSESQPLGDTGREVEFRYAGIGGLDRAFLGFGHNIILKRDSLGNGPRWSVGANLNYLFGTIDESRKAIYPRGEGYLNTNSISSLTMRDPMFTIGTQYQGDLRKRTGRTDNGLRYLIGASMELPASLNAKYDRLVNSFVIGGSNVEFPVDTISYVRGAKGSVSLPPMYAVGFTVYNSRWALTVEHRRRDWNTLSVDVEGFSSRSDLGTNATYILGGSLKPAGDTRGGFWKTTIYRAGFRYTDDYLVVANNQLKEFGMSFGMSLPVMGSTTRSRLNFGAELGRKGTREDGLIEQRFVDFYLGLTLTPDLREQWFRKRRIE
jgi:hypothetical protein